MAAPGVPASFRFPLTPLAAACLLCFSLDAQAATYVVNDQASLEAAIVAVNASAGANFIEFASDITLSSALTPITGTVTIKGNSHVLDGAGLVRLLEVGVDSGRRILVQVSSLGLKGGLATGETGSNGDGGGLGAGGAIYVNSRADVILSGVEVINNVATGGAGTAVVTTGSGSQGGYGEGGSASGGSAGVGGGNAGTTGGGGGAGLGGGIYVEDGGGLTLSGASLIGMHQDPFGSVPAGNAVAAGVAAGDGSAGSAAGSGIFLQGSGNLTLRVAGTQEMTVADSIADAAGSGLAGASADDKWNLMITGGGGIPLDSDDPGAGSQYARVNLTGANSFGGDLYVTNVDLAINSTASLGSAGSMLALDDGGLYMVAGMDMAHDVVVNSSGARFGVDGGTATLSGDIAGNGMMVKVGTGSINLQGTTSASGTWMVRQGGLILDSDAHLGNAALVLNTGSLVFGAAFNDLRTVTMVSSGGIDNGGFDVEINNAVTGTGTVMFSGAGHVQVNQQMSNTGGTRVAAGTVTGRIGTGDLQVDTGAVYELGDASRQVGVLRGEGAIVLGTNTLTTSAMGTNSNPVDERFTGSISGDGALRVEGNKYYRLTLSGLSSYSGGTTISGATLAITNDGNLGTGPVTLNNNGLLQLLTTSSNLDVIIDGSGRIGTDGADVVMNGEISSNGQPVVFTKTGLGTLYLNHANNFAGTTVVSDDGSLIALMNADGLGQSDLELSDGGGLRLMTDVASLREIRLTYRDGIIDTNGYNATSTESLSGNGNLVKNGGGTLLLLANSTYAGSTSVNAGVLQVGDGGSTGSLGGNDTHIGTDATLLFNRDGLLRLAGVLDGDGHLEKSGSSRLELTTTPNQFNGSMAVSGGTLAFYHDGQLGRYNIQLSHGGGLELDTSLRPGSDPDPDPSYLVVDGVLNLDVELDATGGSLVSSAGNQWTMDGDISGSGRLYKTGTGTVVVTGVAGQDGGTEIMDGTLRIGEGVKGSLMGDVQVHSSGSLVFGREDITQYDDVISGDGTVVKLGAGELVLTGEQLFSGVFQVQQGNLRIGLGGSRGSLSGDVDLAAGTLLIFDRSDDSVFLGNSYGDGSMQKTGPGKLTVVGDVAQTGGTLLNSGVLQIGDGGTVGNIHNNVITVTGSQLVINRSDDVEIAANVSGAGLIVQDGLGTTTLTGNNSHTGGVIVENGHLAIDSDARLGSTLGKLIIRNGGILTFLDDFSLRGITLEPSGGGLDTNGFDIHYSSLVTGSGNFIKEGAGQLTITRLLVEGDLDVRGGDLRLGDGSDDASGSAALGNADIASGAALSINRNGLVNFEGSLTGSGIFRQVGTSELRLPGDSSSFTGTTYIDNGSLRLDGTLGGDLNLASGTRMQGHGSVLGDVVSTGGVIRPGNSIGTLTLGSLTLDADSVLEIEVDAAGATDKLNVTGAANLAGTLNILPQAGDYTAPGCCTYTIINAGSINGTFSTVNNDLVFLNTSVSYLPTQVDISFVRNNTGFNTVSLTYNQHQVSAAIDVMEAADPADPIAAQIALMSANQARAAFDVLSGDSLLSAVNASARSARRFSHMLSARSSRLGLASRGGATEPMEKSLAAVRAGQMPQAPAAFASSLDPMHYDGPTSKVEGIWVEANGFKLTEDADDTVGSASSTFTGQLLAMGVDGYWTDNLIVGFGAGYLQGDLGVDNRKSEGDATGMFAGTYGRWETDSGWHYKGALTLGKQDTDQTREGVVGVYAGTASSSSSVMSAGAEFEAGLALHLGNYGLRPYAIIDAQFLKRDAFAETGAGPANLQVAAATDVAGEFGVGAEISRPWLTAGARWAQIQAGLALLQPFGDTQRQQTVNFSGASNSFTVKATPDDSAALQLTIGGEWYLSKSVAVWGGYEGRLSSTTQEHNAVLSFQYRW